MAHLESAYSLNEGMATIRETFWQFYNNELANQLIVYQMEFDKTGWSCSWNSDQNCAQNSGGGGGPEGGWVYITYNITV